MKSKYKEIFKLKKMLEDAHIPFDWRENWGHTYEELDTIRKSIPGFEHYQICYPVFAEDMRYMSVIEGYGTFGEAHDLLEVMGGFTEEETGGDAVMGSVTATEVFKRIKAHYYRKGGITIMKKIKIVDEDTLEMKEVEIEETPTDEMLDTFADQLRTALNCEPEEFYLKYKNYKKAEAEFKKLYDPFKEKLIKLHEETPSLPKSVVIGGTRLTYVSPSTRSTIDSKKLKEEEPEIAEKFTKTTSVNATIRLEEV